MAPTKSLQTTNIWFVAMGKIYKKKNLAFGF
jgi:hypothetical protein